MNGYVRKKSNRLPSTESFTNQAGADKRFLDIVFWITAFFLFFWALGHRGLCSPRPTSSPSRSVFLSIFFHLFMRP